MEIISTLISIIATVLSIYISSLYYQKIAVFLKYPLHGMFLLYIIIVGLFFFQLLPAILRVFSGWKYEKIVGVMPSEVALVYILELISFVVWIVSTYLIIKFVKKKPNYVNIRKKKRSRPSALLNITKIFSLVGKLFSKDIVNESKGNFKLKVFIFTLLLGGFWVNFYSIYNPNATLVLDWLLRPLLTNAGLALAISSIILGRSFFGKIWNLKIAILSWLVIVPSLATGSHGNIISIVIYLSFSFFFVKRSKLMGILLLSGVIIVVIFNDELHSMRSELRTQDNVTLEQRFETFINADSDNSNSSLLDKMERRFGENSRVSVGYLRMVEKGDQAELRSITNSFYSFLPRSLYPDKPYSGSADGTKYGAGMYQIHREINGNPYNMSGFLTGLHAYWEYGIIFVIVSAVLSAMYTAFILLVSERIGVLGISLVILHIDTWWQMPKIWPSEIILQLIGYIGTFIIYLYIAKVIGGKPTARIK